MKLFELRPVEGLKEDNPWNPWYDKSFGFIVRAETEEEARKIAHENSGDEALDEQYNRTIPAWLNKEYSTCTELTDDGEAGMIMQDFARA
jgi:hypothetical protein